MPPKAPEKGNGFGKQHPNTSIRLSDSRLRDSLQAPILGNSQFLNTLTDSAAANLVWYKRHHLLLLKACLSSEVLTKMTDLEGLDLDDLPSLSASALERVKKLQHSCEHASPDVLQRILQDLAASLPKREPLISIESNSISYLDPSDPEVLREDSSRPILTFGYMDGTTHSSAILRNAPSMAKIIGAIPSLIGKKSAFLSYRTRVDYKAMERRDERRAKADKHRRQVFQRERWYAEWQERQEKFNGNTECVLLRVYISKNVKRKHLQAAANAVAKAEGSDASVLQEALAQLNACAAADISQSDLVRTDNVDVVDDGEAMLELEDLGRMVDVGMDEGGARELVDIEPGSICWISAMPSPSLPVVPLHVLAEMGVANIGHNLVQASLHKNGHKVTLGSIAAYEGLTERPFLSNHLWTRCVGADHADIDPRRSTVQGDLIQACGEVKGRINIPIPSPLCPLEGVVLEVDNSSALVEVRMPLDLAAQWFSETSTSAPAAEPVPLPSGCEDRDRVLALTKQHILAQTGWPVQTPSNVSWVVMSGPSVLMTQRTMAALDTLTTGKFTGSDAVRHVVCRVQGLPLLDPEGPRRALQRILGLDEAGVHVPGCGSVAVLERLHSSLLGQELLATIGAVSGPCGTATSTSTSTSTFASTSTSTCTSASTSTFTHQPTTPVADVALQWANVSRYLNFPAILRILCTEMAPEEVCAVARVSSLVEPASRLERTSAEAALDTMLCRRLRTIEFSRESYMPPTPQEVVEGKDLEETIEVTKAGRFYFRRMHVGSNPGVALEYVRGGNALKGYNTRITNAQLTKHLRASSFTYQALTDSLLRHYASATPMPGVFAYPPPEQRGMHPQANHNPLPEEELARAQRILQQLPQLNDSQRAAIMLTLNQSFTLIQGPPGTGKTQTITTLVWLWVCALGVPLPFPDKHLPYPDKYLSSLTDTVAAPPRLYTAQDFVSSPHTEIEGLVTQTLDCPHALNAVLAAAAQRNNAASPYNAENKNAAEEVDAAEERDGEEVKNAHVFNAKEITIVPEAVADTVADTATDTVDLRTAPPPLPQLPRPSSDVLRPLNVSGRGPALICAFTNVAVDEICARLLALPGFHAPDGVKPLFTVVRFGNSKKIDPRVEKARLRWHLSQDADYMAEYEKLHGNLSDAHAAVNAATALVPYLNSLQGFIEAVARTSLAAKAAPTPTPTSISTSTSTSSTASTSTSTSKSASKSVDISNFKYTSSSKTRDLSSEASYEELDSKKGNSGHMEEWYFYKCSIPHPENVKKLMEIAKFPLNSQMSCEDVCLRAAALVHYIDDQTRSLWLLNKRLNEARLKAEDGIMNSASVIVCTCIGAGSYTLNNLRFSLVIVDECSQVPEPACLIPISRLAPCDPCDFTGDIGASSVVWQRILAEQALQSQELVSQFGLHPSKRSLTSFSRVVLVGDQCQLPPVVDSELMKLAGVHISLFERLMTAMPDAATSLRFDGNLTNNPAHPRFSQASSLTPRTALLHTQYRMHATLAAWISKHIYSDRITSGTHPLHRKSVPGFPWPVALAQSPQQDNLGDTPTNIIDTPRDNPSDVEDGEGTRQHHGNGGGGDSLARAVVSQLLALEHLASHYAPQVPVGRLSRHLLSARATRDMDGLMSTRVPHASMVGRGIPRFINHVFDACWCDNHEHTRERYLHAFHLRKEMSRYVADLLRVEEGACGYLHNRKVTFQTGTGAPLIEHLPIVFIDVPFTEDNDGMYSASKRNIHEAQLVAHITASILGALPTLQQQLQSSLANMFVAAARTAVEEQTPAGSNAAVTTAHGVRSATAAAAATSDTSGTAYTSGTTGTSATASASGIAGVGMDTSHRTPASSVTAPVFINSGADTSEPAIATTTTTGSIGLTAQMSMCSVDTDTLLKEVEIGLGALSLQVSEEGSDASNTKVKMGTGSRDAGGRAVADTVADTVAASPTTVSTADTVQCTLERLAQEHQLSHVGTAADRKALYELLSHTWLSEAVQRAHGERVDASELGVVTPYVGQVRAVREALEELHLACSATQHTNRGGRASGHTDASMSTFASTSASSFAPNSTSASTQEENARKLLQVEVKSIDGFQGREKDIIIMSCVRSNAYKQMGFVADLRRLNVAVSRAKRGLIVIGNKNTLSSHPLWASYIHSIERCGGVISYHRLMPWLHAGLAFPDFL